jgi:hypothetical protein
MKPSRHYLHPHADPESLLSSSYDKEFYVDMDEEALEQLKFNKLSEVWNELLNLL